MAVTFPENIDILDDLMTCGFCHKTLTNPKLLPCQHSCCVECVEVNITSPDFMLLCPSCEGKVNVHDGDVRQLPDNFLVHIIQEQKSVPSDNNAKCLPCEIENKETKATHQCLDCPDTFCSGCKKFHFYSSLSKNHKVVEIKDIKKGKHSEEMKEKKIKLCPKHSKTDKKIPLDLYCEDCQSLVCQICVILEHKSHTCNTVDVVNDKARSTLQSVLKPLETKQEKEAKFSHHLDNTVKTLNREKEATDDIIHKEAAELHDLVDKIKEEKLENVKINHEHEIRKVTEAKAKSQLMKNQTDTMKAFTEAFLQHSSNVDFLNYFKDVESRVKACMERKEDYTITTKHMKIKNKPCIEAKDIIEEIIGTISIRDNREDTTERHISRLTDMCEPQIVYDIREVHIAIQGISVTKDNNIIVVGGTKVGVFSNDGIYKRWLDCQGLISAWDVAVNGHCIYVTDTKARKLRVVDMNGAIQRFVEMPQGDQDPSCTLGVCVNDNDDVFIASFQTKTVYKLTRQSTTLETFLTNSSNPGLTGPYYICVTPKQELIVSNFRSNNIQAYNMKGQLLWQYDGGRKMAFNSPEGVCSDREGNVYLCDIGNNRIQVIKDGNFIAAIQPKGLNSPQAVTINCDHELVIVHRNGIMKVKVWK